MTLREQGAYRNLLDELWLRDGWLPADERILANICGDALEWPSVREKVLARFTLTEKGWSHPTHDEVSSQSKSFRDAQADAGRARASKASRDASGRLQPASQLISQPAGPAGKPAGKDSSHQPPSPSPSPSPDQTQTPKKEKISERTERAPHLDSVEASAGFSAFWAAYPRKVGKDAAFRAFQKHAPTAALVDTMLRALTRQRQTVQWQKDDGQFIPHPATWLNQGRWQDEPDTPMSALASVPNSNGRNCPHDQPCPSAGFCYRRRQFDQAVADGSITQTEADSFLAKLRATA
jgi:uncharacterized protein YdaU (DUF1376 family)